MKPRRAACTAALSLWLALLAPRLASGYTSSHNEAMEIRFSNGTIFSPALMQLQNLEALMLAEHDALHTQEGALQAIVKEQGFLVAKQQALQLKEIADSHELRREIASEEVKLDSLLHTYFAPDIADYVFGLFFEPKPRPAGLVLLESSQTTERVNKNDKPDLHAMELGIVVYLVLVLGVGFIYQQFMSSVASVEALRRPALQTQENFAFALCDGLFCDPNPKICMCSFFCIPVRWAATATSPKVKFMNNFYFALVVFSVCGISWQLCSTLMYGFGMLPVLVLGLLVQLNRQRIRQVYRLPQSLRITIEDCLVWTCCAPCAMMQESMQVEFIEPV